MITVAQAAEKIINRSRYLSEAISKGLINTSALARYIRPEVEQMLVKDVSEAAILMAINRLAQHIKPNYSSHPVLKSPPEMILRSQLTMYSSKQIEKGGDIVNTLIQLPKTQQSFLLFSLQSTLLVICSKDYEQQLHHLEKNGMIVKKQNGVSTITIVLPKTILDTPGICYFFLKSLAWEGINILEIISLETEFTLIVEEKDAQNAFGILQSLFQK